MDITRETLRNLYNRFKAAFDEGRSRPVEFTPDALASRPDAGDFPGDGLELIRRERAKREKK